MMARGRRVTKSAATAVGLCALAVTACGAARIDSHQAFADVAGIVAERTGQQIVWPVPATQEEAAAAETARLLGDGLGTDDAVRIALLNNRELRAAFAEIGIAQADLVQAGLLHNPVFDAGVGFPPGGGLVDLGFRLATDVADLVYAPRRTRVASAELEATKLAVAGEVLATGWAVRTAFIRHQANEQLVEMRKQVVAATHASYAVARRMRAAGNITELELAQERALAEQARLDLRAAEIDARQSREELNRLLGLWGTDTQWALEATRLPDPPDDALDPIGLETRAVGRSLELAAASQRIVAAAENLGLNRADALFPEVVLGAAGEREGDWDTGPTLALPIPLFDRGQARKARARAELERAREQHYALAVAVRSRVRAARDRVIGERERAMYYRDVLLPLREKVVRETQLHYNAMQVGVLELLRAMEQQIDTGARYVETLRDYWLARADLDLLLAGRLPPSDAVTPAPRPLEQLPRFPFPTVN